METTTLRLFGSLRFVVGLTIILLQATGSYGQADYRQGYTYKICAVDNLCLSSYEKPSIKEGLGKVTGEKYANVLEQHWQAKQGFINSEYGLTQLVPQNNKYNDITYSILPHENTPSTNFWRISPVPDDAPWYTIQLYTHSPNNETELTNEHVLGCIQHMGQKLRVQVMPCTYNEFQKWKFGLISKINNYSPLIRSPSTVELIRAPSQLVQ